MAADLPPLSDEERADFLRYCELAGPAITGPRLIALHDALAARVSSLEAERMEAINKALQAEVKALAPLGALLEKAQEVRRAWDAWRRAGDALANVAGVVAVGVAIDALIPPLESPWAPKEDA